MNIPRQKQTHERVSFKWLADTRIKVAAKEARIEDEILKAILIDPPEIRSIGMGTYYKACRHYAFESIKTGPKGKPKNFEIILDIIRNYKIRGIEVGILKTYKMIKRDTPEINVDIQTISNVYSYLGIKELKLYSKPKYRCRYTASKSNTLWHIDIHYPKDSSKYIYGIIDDYSRYLLDLVIVEVKTALDCSIAFERAVEKYGAPAVVLSDNGGENVGSDFRNMLKKHQIRFLTTEPYNPEQNGKIERVWPSFEKMCITDANSIARFLNNYNDVIPHCALNFKVPADYYHDMDNRWVAGMPIEYYVDGILKPIPLND